jgi:DNA mismatch repair protein MutL
VALPAIASVARLTLRTRPSESDAGFRLAIEGGTIRARAPDGCRVGTQVEVADQFYNTPARRKFMRSSATEAAQASDTLAKLALGAPGVHFTLAVDGRRSLDLPPCASRLERARAALGRRGARLGAIAHEEPGLAIEACLAPPEQAGRTAASVALIVNQRLVRDRVLVHAAAAGYGDLIPPGHFPLGVLYLDIDPAAIDVNVHPQKLEVRLAEPGRVHAAVRRCVESGLARERAPAAAPAHASYALHASDGARAYEEQKQRLAQAARRFWSAQRSFAAEASAGYGPTARDGPRPSRQGFWGTLRVLGQALGCYLVCEAGDELVLVDHRAAQQELALAGLRRVAGRGEIPSQRLLVPAIVALEPALEARARAAAGALRALGLEVDAFGGASFAVRALPAPLLTAEPAALLRDVLEELGRLDATDALAGAELDDLLARMASHGALPGPHPLGEEDVAALLASLDELELDASCPVAGRQVALRLARSELAERFGR